MSKQTKCPKCKSAKTLCVDSRMHRKNPLMVRFSMDVRYRRYKCCSCNHRWSTHELPELYFKEIEHTSNKVKNLLSGTVA